MNISFQINKLQKESNKKMSSCWKNFMILFAFNDAIKKEEKHNINNNFLTIWLTFHAICSEPKCRINTRVDITLCSVHTLATHSFRFFVIFWLYSFYQHTDARRRQNVRWTSHASDVSYIIVVNILSFPFVLLHTLIQPPALFLSLVLFVIFSYSSPKCPPRCLFHLRCVHSA